MGWVTPYGSDRPVWRDAVTEPAYASTEEELDAALPGRKAARDLALRDGEADTRRAISDFEGSLLTQGHTAERAGQIARVAARRHETGRAVPFRDNHSNTAASRGHGGR